MRPAAEDFRAALRNRFERATEAGKKSLEVRSGELHKEVGGYPGLDHRMPTCCDVMRGEMTKADELVSAPPKGKGASVVIRYRLPRSH
ncbi:MAG: HNH endonuclease [Boseongicola sp. SB0664_bin_43]|uniref:HNH endonuclease n=1 Tax=Boseongicola sp. SB0664_bin_43 TaxID=2604844 RepID=A0A6B0Y7J7_9RHOB|nr:HNH endonuclease [Boseongicola sp. SB0664_bin_43]MYK32862.1 HNH endonuclease [Boseongicola sp. SB0670_bin_30]